MVVNDDCIHVEGEGTPNVVGLFKGRSEDMSSMNKYDCDLADLPVIILQQVICCFILFLGVVSKFLRHRLEIDLKDEKFVFQLS